MKRTRKSRPSETPKAKVTKVRSEATSGIVDKDDAKSSKASPEVGAAAPHPLLNNVVLKHLFGYLVESDLRSCRRVHPTWDFEALPHLKKRGRNFLQIRTYPHLCNFNYAAYFRKLSNYIKDTSESDIPFSVGKVCFSKMHTDLQVYGTAWRELIAVLATRVTEVEVIVRDYVSPCIPSGITFPKLTTLRVRQGNWNYLEAMLKASPNLKTVELEHGAWNYRTLRTLLVFQFQMRPLSSRYWRRQDELFVFVKS